MAASKQPASPFVDAELLEGVMKFQPLSGKQFQFFVIRALERLETQMKDLLGNGQPGRITQLVGRVHKLETQFAACAALQKNRVNGKKGKRPR